MSSEVRKGGSKITHNDSYHIAQRESQQRHRIRKKENFDMIQKIFHQIIQCNKAMSGDKSLNSEECVNTLLSLIPGKVQQAVEYRISQQVYDYRSDEERVRFGIMMEELEKFGFTW